MSIYNHFQKTQTPPNFPCFLVAYFFLLGSLFSVSWDVLYRAMTLDGNVYLPSRLVKITVFFSLGFCMLGGKWFSVTNQKIIQATQNDPV